MSLAANRPRTNRGIAFIDSRSLRSPHIGDHSSPSVDVQPQASGVGPRTGRGIGRLRAGGG